ncbi:MAG: hypothetical protein Q9195_004527 [Heterodermia aff. obscurata]
MTDSATSTPKSYHTDPTLYLYTSLTAGSSQIITATSRLETILKAHRIPFQALDVATDEKARMLWGRRAGKKKLPGLVRMGLIVGDLEEIEEWNEYGELKDHLGGLAASTPTPSATNTPSKPPSTPSTNMPAKPPPSPLSALPKQNPSSSVETPPPRPPPQTATDSPLTTAMRQAGFEAAKKAGDAKKAKLFASAKEPESETLEGQGQREGVVDEGSLKKLDNSGPLGMPPPSGSTEAEDAKAPETAGANVESKADETPSSEPDSEVREGIAGTAGDIENLKDEGTDLPLRSSVKNVDAEVEHSHGTTEPVITTMGQKTEKGKEQGDTRALEEDGGLKGAIETREKEEEDDVAEYSDGEKGTSIKTEDVSAAADGTKSLPGTKTQEQSAAKGEEAGTSVGD